MPYPIYPVNERVGIGTPSPDVELDVRGDTQITGDLDVTGTITAGGTPVGALTIGTFGSTPDAKGATASGLTLTLQPADGTHPGALTSGTQTIGGAKTFSSTITASNLSGTNTGDLTLAAVGSAPDANGATLASQVLTLQPADGTHPGVVTAAAQSFGGAKTFAAGAISDSVTSATAATLVLSSSVADGAGATAVKTNSSVALANATARLLSVQNNGTEKFGVDKNGALVPGSDGAASVTLGTSSLRWTNVNTTALLNQSDTRVGFASGASNTYADGIGSPGAASVAHSFNTHAAFSTAGGKLVSVKNNSTEKFFIDKDGNLEVNGGASGFLVLQSPDGTRYKLSIANGGTVSITAA